MIGFQLILPVTNHNDTKNLMGHRVHAEGAQIYQMNRQINSLNLFGMLQAKIDRFARKIDSLPKKKKHLEIAFLVGPGGQTVDSSELPYLPTYP